MDMLAEILAKYGLDKSKLNAEELATLSNWASALSQNRLTLADVLTHIEGMTEAVERELADPPKSITDWLFRKKRQAHLIARLQNYLMLRDFITKPERARKFMEASLKRVAPTMGGSK